MKEIILSNMTDFVTVTLMWYFGCKVLGSRFNKLLTYIIQFIFFGFVGPAIFAKAPQAISMAAAIAAMFAQFIILYRGSLKSRIIAMVIAYTVVNIILIFPFFLTEAMEIENTTRYTLTLNAMYLAVGLCTFYLVGQIWENISFVLGNVRFLTFFLLPVTQFAMSMFVVFYLSHNPVSGSEHIYQLQTNRTAVYIFTSILALSLLADGLFLQGFAKLATGIRERALIEQLEQRNDMSYEYIKNMESDIEDMSKYRHDSLNLLASIKLAMENGEEGRAGAADMIDRLTESVKELTGGQYSSNIMVNCILTYMRSKAERDGIKAELRAEVGRDTEINDTDLCRLLMNMLDNAREACLAVSEPEKRTVCFNMREKNGYLYAVCRNPRPEGEFSPTTGKEDKKHHGLGLRIMRDVVEKYDGELIIEPEDGSVTVTAALRIPPRDSAENAVPAKMS